MSNCNVYEVEVTISQVGGYNPGGKNPEYTRKEKVLAVSEDAAVRKVERALKWDIREVLKNSGGYVISHQSKLLLEDVTY